MSGSGMLSQAEQAWWQQSTPCQCLTPRGLMRGPCTFPPRDRVDEADCTQPHVARLRTVEPGSSLIGGAEQLCSGFYHANQWEADVILCLRSVPAELTRMREDVEKKKSKEDSVPSQRSGGDCSKAQVAIVARLLDAAGGVLYVARYANCFRGRSELNVHAEEFMLQDPGLEYWLSSPARAPAPPAELELYMSYQPCHHSGGSLPIGESEAAMAAVAARRANNAHPTTCSERLAAWVEEELRPRGVRLTLVLADLYKVLWSLELMGGDIQRAAFGADSQAGLRGMLLLLRLDDAVSMRALGDADWAFLVSLCDEAVQRAYEARGGDVMPFTRTHTALRARLDAHINAFLEKLAPMAHLRDGDDDDGADAAQCEPATEAAPPALEQQVGATAAVAEASRGCTPLLPHLAPATGPMGDSRSMAPPAQA
jgi:hypothetical protein